MGSGNEGDGRWKGIGSFWEEGSGGGSGRLWRGNENGDCLPVSPWDPRTKYEVEGITHGPISGCGFMRSRERVSE